MTIDELIIEWNITLEVLAEQDPSNEYIKGRRERLEQCIEELKQLKEQDDNR